MGLRFKMKDGSMRMPAMSRTTAPKAAEVRKHLLRKAVRSNQNLT